MGTLVSLHWRARLGAVVALASVAYLGVSLVIGCQVRCAVAAAQELEGGDPVPALLAVVQSEEATIRSRNRAMWALGQLGAREALPVLEPLVTGEGCDHDARICQYELRKAIVACSGSPNAGAVIWRHGDLAVK